MSVDTTNIYHEIVFEGEGLCAGELRCRYTPNPKRRWHDSKILEFLGALYPGTGRRAIESVVIVASEYSGLALFVGSQPRCRAQRDVSNYQPASLRVSMHALKNEVIPIGAKKAVELGAGLINRNITNKGFHYEVRFSIECRVPASLLGPAPACRDVCSCSDYIAVPPRLCFQTALAGC